MAVTVSKDIYSVYISTEKLMFRLLVFLINKLFNFSFRYYEFNRHKKSSKIGLGKILIVISKKILQNSWVSIEPGKPGICLKLEGDLENLEKGKLFNKKPGKSLFFGKVVLFPKEFAK